MTRCLADKIKEYLKTSYPQFQEIISIKPIHHEGLNSKNYIFYVNKTPYILRNFTDRSSREQIESICEILNFCRKNGCSVSQPIKNKYKNYVDKRSHTYVTRYYKGKLGGKTQKEIQDAARELAIVHKSLKSYKKPYNYRPKHTLYKPLNQQELEKIKKRISLKQNPDQYDKIVLKSFQQILTIYSFLMKTHLSQNCGKQIIHFDLHPGNMIFNKKKIVSIIDFNLMRRSYAIYDIVYASFRLAIYSTKNKQRMIKLLKTFISSYRKENRIYEKHLMNFDYFLLQILYSYLSSILRCMYFRHDMESGRDLKKFVNFITIAYDIRNQIKDAMRSTISGTA